MSLLSKHIGNHARTYAGLAGVAVFLAGVLGTVLLVASMQMGDMTEVQARTVDQLEAVARDTNEMLARLNREFQPECTPENLARLRGVLFGTRFQRDIGLFDGENRLACTTSLGNLRAPVRIQAPQIQLLDKDGLLRASWFNLRVAVGGGKHNAIVVQHGPFNTVIDPRITSELFGYGASHIGYRLTEGGLFPVRAKGETPAALREHLAASALAARTEADYDWKLGAFVHSAPVPDTRFVVQTYATLGDAAARHAQVILFLVSVSALLGVLYCSSAAPRFARLAELDHRIASLVWPEHVVCVYQPIMDLQSGAPVGCEVLMRLRDGAETLFPDAVIPAVMAQGLTWQLDQAVIRKGLAELARHLPPAGEFRISFNLFPQNIRFDALHQLLTERLQALGRTDLRIDLEVIEQDYDASMLEEVGKLKAAGYMISVDDFGTGFSNLGSVKKLSPSFLKIDKSFIFDMEDASVRSSLIPEIVGIAKAVGAQVVAEGVENALQADRLRAHGVQYGQGYFFSRPLPIEQFVRFLEKAPLASSQGHPLREFPAPQEGARVSTWGTAAAE
ncbi:MAG TPA: EAL domain-containing protein [Burkholderiaceae bacterium]|nr:EAL domain-containing protein [Burkholderiaceae bacterium]